ncbi:MAG: hypothetical protein HY452_02150 [Parcubacteria group bacterium]|uniref:Uncharacterized protein n=1 Tax=Candidatus Sungiibacteriota bacterium TaxID=2750080 RepID=A0A9D6HPR8_9BACT|nr:hypothetical protein [Candidatus Sungbacteria bacterium]MBI4119043.1 hypothetical protein [Parcubacteria group bacterium]
MTTQLTLATVRVKGSCLNWSHYEEEEYSHSGDEATWTLGWQAAQHRAIARLQLDHFRRCGCGQAEYQTLATTI